MTPPQDSTATDPDAQGRTWSHPGDVRGPIPDVDERPSSAHARPADCGHFCTYCIGPESD